MLADFAIKFALAAAKRSAGAGGTIAVRGYTRTTAAGIPVTIAPSTRTATLATVGGTALAAHYGRNTFNGSPDPKTVERAWTKLTPAESIYHRQGKDGAGNTKYVSPSGRREAVINARGEIVTDVRNRGTYNYAGPRTAHGIPHAMLDVVPYLVFGNTPRDMIASAPARIGLTAQGMLDAFAKRSAR